MTRHLDCPARCTRRSPADREGPAATRSVEPLTHLLLRFFLRVGLPFQYRTLSASDSFQDSKLVLHELEGVHVYEIRRWFAMFGDQHGLTANQVRQDFERIRRALQLLTDTVLLCNNSGEARLWGIKNRTLRPITCWRRSHVPSVSTAIYQDLPVSHSWRETGTRPCEEGR